MLSLAVCLCVPTPASQTDAVVAIPSRSCKCLGSPCFLRTLNVLFFRHYCINLFPSSSQHSFLSTISALRNRMLLVLLTTSPVPDCLIYSGRVCDCMEAMGHNGWSTTHVNGVKIKLNNYQMPINYKQEAPHHKNKVKQKGLQLLPKGGC